MLKHEAAVNRFWEILFKFYACKKNTCFKQRRIPAPPFLLSKCCEFGLAFLDDGKRILVWEVDNPGVFCYDFTLQYNGWTRLSPPSPLADKLPFIKFSGKRPFFIHDSDPDMANFLLMFNYDPQNEPLLVSAYLMSTDLLSFKPGKPILLPELCYEYLLMGEHAELKHEMPNISSDFEFVNLGERKFGLVLHKHSRGTPTGIILLMIFDYEIIKTTSEIQTRLVMTRRFRYPVWQHEYTEGERGVWLPRNNHNVVGIDYAKTCLVHLNGLGI
jgi:hypothetical protein